MALHKGQGWLPSNVLATASWNEQDSRLLASMLVQATVCSNAQCALRAATSEKTTRTLPSFKSTIPT